MYRSIHTSYGLARIAEAEATGTPINLTHVAVGDGNGNPVEPSESQTVLVREVYRTTVNRVYQSPNNPKRVVVEMVIPAAVGGFTLREVGVFDADGGLFVVGNLPNAYKPEVGEGSFADTIVRLEIVVSNASVITLQIDPNVAVASRAWVLANIDACHVLPGGTTGQVLRKVSNSCGDTEWADPSDANVLVSTREERQTLAASQTIVNLTTTNTSGAAVYVDGIRIPRMTGVDGWQPDVTNPDTKIVLGSSYPDGSQIVIVQNDPLGGIEFPLARAQNLADVPDKAAARNNLDVFSRAESRQLSPAGQVAFFARNTAPTGWLKANGAAVSRTAYADLFAAIGTAFGGGDGFNTFNLPDLRGEFVRGWDDGRGVDAGRSFGGAQSHALGMPNSANGNPVLALFASTALGTIDSGNGMADGINFADGGSRSITRVQPQMASETRPRNRALLACIKF